MEYVPAKVIVDAQVNASTPSYRPKVTQDPTVHVKTASASYDRLLDNGPLTDRKIKRYIAMGFYGGTGLVLPRDERENVKKDKKSKAASAKKKLKQVLLDEYN